MSLVLPATLMAQEAGPSASQDLETVLITAKRDDRRSSGATGLDLDLKDTPQSISLVTSQQMEIYGANSLNEALRLAPGLNVEEWETNRTNYMARGFEIKSTQIDGIGLPNDWGIVTGAMDSFGYEKLEVIRGANGLLTGVGNASGTINYVRKRPLNEQRTTLEVTGGSWDLKRIEADYSTPLTDSGSWAARAVVAAEDRDSYVRDLANDRLFFYGVVDGQIGERSTLTLGLSYQDADTDGNMWGALVLSNDDGTQAEFGRSASTTQDWTFWNTTNQTAFAEYTYELPHEWQLKATYNYRKIESDSKLFYAYSNTGLDPVTGEGLVGWPGSWPSDDHANLADVSASGEFSLFGREHQAMFGLSYSTSENVQDQRPVDFSDPAFGPLPAFPFGGDAVAEPTWGAREENGVINQRLKRAFGATRFSLTDRLSALVGFNLAEYHRDGHSSQVPFSQTERELSPYAGLTFDITDRWLAYASYSDIYQPQDQQDINEQYLDPSQGVNYEVGLKAEWFDKSLLTTLAWFSAEQRDLSTFVGINDNGIYYYEGVDVNSEGIELEVSGRVNDFVDLTFGFTTLQLDDEQGEDIYEWVPRRTATLAASSRLPGFEALSLGISGRWQSEVSTIDSTTLGLVRQDSYATVNAFASWKVSDHATVRANVNNVSDEKFITSLYQVGYYGAPRNYSLSFGYRF